MNMFKNFNCLTDEEYKAVHKTRIAAKYKYRKPVYKSLNMYMSLDETYYYNVFIYNYKFKYHEIQS